MIVGFDVGGTNVRAVGLRPGSVEPLGIRRGKTVADGDGLVATVIELTEGLADDVGEAVDAVGLGVAALLDSDGVLKYAPKGAGGGRERRDRRYLGRITLRRWCWL